MKCAASFSSIAVLLPLSMHAQSADAAGRLRTLLRETPRLSLEQIPIASRMPNAASLGTVSSVAADRNGTIYVLQRGDKADPVIAVDKDGHVLRSWGKGMFTVPHSVRVDPDGNIWTVDAGSSVLLKFSPEGKRLQEISVGEIATGNKCAFPTLCGTTDVTFAPNGRLFISDGYGNARILEYSADGKRLNVWGSAGTGPGQFQIPHGIAVNGNTLYVADRGNARIQKFDLNGRYLGEWTHLGRPFALKIAGGALWVATMTMEQASQNQAVRASPWVLKVDPATGQVLGQIESSGPHSIEVNDRGEVYASGCCGGSNPNGFSWFRNEPNR
ncbi:MAG TPA: peptidyl-alpha-hydroxyglycine alpha-amidating lyase family protein [Bryobacteraceae bacterium]|jgi:DNA-binding beta-propeller fold protein YncE